MNSLNSDTELLATLQEAFKALSERQVPIDAEIQVLLTPAALWDLYESDEEEQ